MNAKNQSQPQPQPMTPNESPAPASSAPRAIEPHVTYDVRHKMRQMGNVLVRMEIIVDPRVAPDADESPIVQYSAVCNVRVQNQVAVIAVPPFDIGSEPAAFEFAAQKAREHVRRETGLLVF